MLQSEVQTAARAAHLDDLEQAALQALTAGVTRDEVMTTLSAVIDHYHGRQDPMPGLLPCDDSDRIFDELPDGMIDLPSAAKKHRINRSTIRHWVKTGKVPCQGRIKGSATGGGYLLIYETDLIDYLSAPRDKGGRPPKPLRTT